MKKMNILKIAFTFVMVLSVTIVFGQEMNAHLTADQTADQYVTVNKAMPYHVTPDSYFNPNYNAGGAWAVTSDFAWSFTTDPTSFTITDATVINPDITIGTVGDYVLNVVETSSDGCTGTTRSLNIHVLAAPTADFSAADVENCGTYTSAVTVDIADNTATDFLVDYTLVVQNYLADKVTTDGAVISTTATTDVSIAAVGAQQLVASTDYTVLNNKVTRYTFTINGVNDAVSRVSDYIAPNGRAWPIAAFTEYASATDDTFIITVLPSPTTGTIYHIPN